MKRVENEFVVAAQIAHIRGLEFGSARYEPEMSDDDRNAFDNLIFFCFLHHRTVDKYPNRYPADELQVWKSAREADGLGSLRGLNGLTEERLQEMIRDAYAQRDAVVQDTLTRLERHGDNAADVIRELLGELVQLRIRGEAFPDRDAVAMLMEASRRLDHLQDDARLMVLASESLASLGNVAADLFQAAGILTNLNLQDVALRLNRAAEDLRGIQGQM